ncbi:MAG: hypothetical protein IH908_14750, partial [Proteobacteria bacterium]|nr:hypothetical protein [Pseudomonadota bacterium]
MTRTHTPEELPELEVVELIARGRTLEAPFRLRLEDEEGIPIELRCLEVFRLLPARRLVVRCTQAG